MPATDTQHHSLMWLFFALLTVLTWGVYGVLIHTGQVAMGDPVNGRYKAFLFVGLAYFLTAVLAPLGIMLVNGASWSMPMKGMAWSLLAGITGAIGAFGVILAFGAAPAPKTAYIPVIMSIIFCGAPIVNALVSMTAHPPAGGLAAIKWQFWLGIILAAGGGLLVSKYKPDTAPTKPGAAQVSTVKP
jgi:hypothetical protein